MVFAFVAFGVYLLGRKDLRQASYIANRAVRTATIGPNNRQSQSTVILAEGDASQTPSQRPRAAIRANSLSNSLQPADAIHLSASKVQLLPSRQFVICALWATFVGRFHVDFTEAGCAECLTASGRWTDARTTTGKIASGD
jgi:hypothetical protein